MIRFKDTSLKSLMEKWREERGRRVWTNGERVAKKEGREKSRTCKRDKRERGREGEGDERDRRWGERGREREEEESKRGRRVREKGKQSRLIWDGLIHLYCTI